MTTTKEDEEALELAWETLIASNPEAREQRIGDIYDRRFASYALQCENLKLKPWQEPPCHLYGAEKIADCDLSASKILNRMLDAGISIYHPDPLAALAGLNVRFHGRYWG